MSAPYSKDKRAPNPKYRIRREYNNEFSSEELIKKIIAAHLKKLNQNITR